MCILVAIFLTFLFNQKENHGFTWPKTFDFLFQKIRILIFFKKSCSLKIAVPEFQKYKKKKLSNLAKDLESKHKYFAYFLGAPTYITTFSVAASVYFNREASQWSTYFLGKYYSRKYLNVKTPHSKLSQGEYLLPGGSTYLLGNM